MENRNGDTATFAEKPRANPSSDWRQGLSYQKMSAEQSPRSCSMELWNMELWNAWVGKDLKAYAMGRATI